MIKTILKNTPLLLFLLFSANLLGQDLKDFNIKFKLSGYFYAQSSIQDSKALGGYGKSDNVAQKIDSKNLFLEKGLFIKIDTTKIITIENQYNGYQLYLVNKTDSIIEFTVSDSRLNIFAEVFYKNKWIAIEYLPTSYCGHSYHKLFLEPNEFWQFKIPKYTGKIKTKLRYRFILDDGSSIFSNEISVSFNKSQIKKIKKYTSNNIMDPYNN